MVEQNFIKLFENSIKSNWERPALSDYFKEDTFTYGQMAKEIALLHLLFAKLGVKKGDKVALIGRNNTRWCISYIAVVTYGAVIVPILQDFNPNDVQHIVNHSDAVLMFAGKIQWEQIDSEKLKRLVGIISLEDFSSLSPLNRSVINNYKENAHHYLKKRYPKGLHPSDVSYPNVSNEEIVLLNYTSGTTGFSKGVMLTGNNLAGNIQFGMNANLHFAGSRCLSFLPLAHAYGCSFDFLLAICSGANLFLLGKIPSPKILLEALAEVKPHLIICVPLILEKVYRKQIYPKLNKPIIKVLLKIPLARDIIYASIRKKLINAFGGEFIQIVVGGAPLNSEVETFFQTIKFPFTIGYGMTECGPLVSYAHWTEFIPTSCGRILHGLMEVKINSEDPFNIPGEICVRGEHVMKGYYKNPEATAAAFENEWLRTGDMGTVDANGTIFIRGRCKSMILGASGQNIYPEEIEAKLNNLPCVLESLVIERQGKVVALVYPDYEQADAFGMDNAAVEKLMEDNRRKLNTLVAPYEAVQSIILYPNEFEKTPKKSIKRYLYTV